MRTHATIIIAAVQYSKSLFVSQLVSKVFCESIICMIRNFVTLFLITYNNEYKIKLYIKTGYFKLNMY